MSNKRKLPGPPPPVYAFQVVEFQPQKWAYRVTITHGINDGFKSEWIHLHTAEDAQQAHDEAERLTKEFLAVNIGGKFQVPRELSKLRPLNFASPTAQPEQTKETPGSDEG